MAALAQPVNQRLRAEGNYRRYQYGRSRGHLDFIRKARRNNNFYLGDGLQWTLEDKAVIEPERKAVEQNEIMPMVNTAVGYQIANRMDIAVHPRGHGADEESATTMGKVIKQVADNNQLHWRETEVFSDGLITSRGYFDVRMSFASSMHGEVKVDSIPSDDVIPDPDANAYDPEDWSDVIITRWYTADEIEQLFGKKARKQVETTDQSQNLDEESGELERRSQFGYNAVGTTFNDYVFDAVDSRRYRIIDRQYRVFEQVLCAIYPTGDIRAIPDATAEQRAAYLKSGALLVKRMQRRVRWLVTTNDTVLFDNYSPYPWFTVVPYFPYFRRGETRGIVDNAISLQELLNKTLSQFLHIINLMANAGWFVEEDSIADRTPEQFEQDVSKNGVIIYYKKGSAAPTPIKPSPIPPAVTALLDMCIAGLRTVTGVNSALDGSGPENEMSGVAYQARQYAAQQKLAIPLDNLARTRYMLSQRILDLIQMFMDMHQILRITETDSLGNKRSVPLPINEPSENPETGEVDYLNDLTLGEYDLVISEQPMQITFENSQFEQVKSLVKDFGYPVPASFALRYSNLSDKKELADAVAAAQTTQPNPIDEAKAALMQAQALKTAVETMNKRIEAVYGATQAGAQIGSMPAVAGIADEILQSAGFDDQNAAPIIPQGGVGAGLEAVAPAAPVAGVEATPTNTNPLTPANPGVGLEAGIEAAGVQ